MTKNHTLNAAFTLDQRIKENQIHGVLYVVLDVWIIELDLGKWPPTSVLVTVHFSMRYMYACHPLSLQNVRCVIQYSPDQNKHVDTEQLYRN